MTTFQNKARADYVESQRKEAMVLHIGSVMEVIERWPHYQPSTAKTLDALEREVARLRSIINEAGWKAVEVFHKTNL